ncbi:hypothetical protein [Saccharolobus caldissimus]|uniref:Uncharacterized protein n=1 Tax=Saccharolobus caldissimus TaxID=1702097 RepID=A0AAQ4CS27_9CREN|nr:hypothetical protein [Saccharolobus caldissimus]BDB98608.1 hypothetical protein SACC_16250 [Saccharolobus caldissimus]
MKIIERLKIDKTESCGSRSPLIIMLSAIRKIRECDEGVEILLNDYDWLLSLKYILQMNDMKLRIEEKGKEDNFLKIEVLMDCN